MEPDEVNTADATPAGTLTFSRGRTWQDFVRSYDILVDGRSVGRLARSSELSVSLPPGSYSCRAQISWTGSATIQVRVVAGRATRVRILPGDQGSRVERALSEDTYLRIELEG